MLRRIWGICDRPSCTDDTMMTGGVFFLALRSSGVLGMRGRRCAGNRDGELTSSGKGDWGDGAGDDAALSADSVTPRRSGERVGGAAIAGGVRNALGDDGGDITVDVDGDDDSAVRDVSDRFLLDAVGCVVVVVVVDGTR